MAKSLDDAIGCWTVNKQFLSLPILAKKVSEAANWCQQRTLSKLNDPQLLLNDLRILRSRLDSMVEVADSAIARCQQIIINKECD